MGLVERYPREVVQAAQICGARATRDRFFPEWKAEEFYSKGLVLVARLPDEPRKGRGYEVAVLDPTKTRRESMTVYTHPSDEEA